MTSCYIIDDESHAIQTLTSYIQNVPQLVLVGASQNPVTGLQEVLANQVDITFLDVDMPELSGLDVADMIGGHTAVIFATAHADYAVHVFEKNVSDFLLKPISFEKFLKAVNRVQGKLEKIQAEPKNDYIYINPGVKGKLVRINLSEITYIEALQNYILIYTQDTKYLTYLTMKEIAAVIGSKHFTRVHKSFIINTDKIVSIERGKVIIQPNVEISIGVNYKEDFYKSIRQLSISSGRSTGKDPLSGFI